MTSAQRKTRAIMFSDIVGYSRMMGGDEERALRLLEEHNAVVVPIIEKEGGKVLKFIGDAVLSSYESASDAVRSGVEIQRALAARNSKKDDEEKILIRIGIHIGDVVMKEGDIFGDGVNIASRIEPLAEPGGICISQTVYDMVRARPEIQTVSLGPKELKNIKEAVNIYKVLVEAEEPHPPAPSPFAGEGESRRGGGEVKKVLWGAVIVLLIAAAGWWFVGRGLHPALKEEEKEKFVIAVAPFYGVDEEAEKEGRVMQALVERRLHEALGQEDDVEILGKEITEIPRSHEEAKALGERLSAAVVIFGEVLTLHGEVEIQPYVAALKPIRWLTEEVYSAEALEAGLAEQDQLKLRKTKAEEIGNVALLVAGAYFGQRRDFDKALRILEKIDPPSPESLLWQGNIYYFRKDWEKSREFCEKAIELDPENPQAYTALGWVYEEQLRFAEARAEFQKALKLDPKYAEAYSGLGWFYDAQGKFEDAIAEFQKALKLNPKEISAHYGLGWIYRQQGKYDEAVAEFQKAIELDPADPELRDNLGWVYFDQNRYDEAIAEFQKILALDPKYPEAHGSLGEVYLAQGKDEEAITEFQKAAVLTPEDPTPHYHLGNLYRGEGKYEEAIAEFQKAAELVPEDARPHIDMGWVYLDRGRYEEAAAEFRKAIALAPKDAWPHYHLGELYRIEGKYEEAIAEFQKAAELDSNLPMPHIRLGWVYRDLGRFEEADTEFRKAIELNPKDAWPHYHLGQLYRTEGKYEKAVAELQKTVELAPENTWPHIHLGRIYREQGRYEEAATEFQKAIALDPKEAWAYNNLGAVYRDQGRYEEAVAEHQKAAELDPKDLNAHFGLGWIYEKQGKYQEAVKEYEAVIELGHPDNVFWRLLYFVALQRAGKPDEAVAHMKEFVEALEGDDWIKPVARFYAGELSEEDVLKAAEDRAPVREKEKKCEAYYYVGMKRLLDSDKEKAREYFEKCIATDVKIFEYKRARWELERLNQQSEAGRR